MIYTIDNHHVLRSAEQLDPDPRGLVLIFEPPRRGATYVLGCDPTVGIPRWDRTLRTLDDRHTDNAAIEIIRVGDPDVQVCEFVAPIDPYALAPYVNALGRFYAGNSDEEEALVVIEVYPGPGFATQRSLIDKFGYTNLYQWKYLDRAIPKITDGLGFYASRDAVRDLWIRGIRQTSNRKLDINSDYFLEELASCQFDVMRQRGEAVGGGHDDRVSAMWMAIFAAHDWTGFSQPENHEVVEGRKSTNWQASDISADEMADEWERIWEELGGNE